MELPVQQNPRPDATEVGSYFVANYPPFSAWSRDHTPAVEQTLATAGPSPAPPLGLYLHIPFCRKRCKFCYFRVYTDRNASEVETYLAGLAAEIALYARQPRLAGRQFEFVYFGGGTPSFLSAEQLKRLIGRINEHFEWSAARCRSTSSPRSATSASRG
jgi:oxygen-independent coproporphyrinogen-3 oxidase